MRWRSAPMGRSGAGLTGAAEAIAAWLTWCAFRKSRHLPTHNWPATGAGGRVSVRAAPGRDKRSLSLWRNYQNDTSMSGTHYWLVSYAHVMRLTPASRSVVA